MLPLRSIAATAAVLLTPVMPICAQEAQGPPRNEFSGDLGFVSVSGNTSVITFNVAEKLILRRNRWEFRQDFGTVYGKTDGTESSNLWRAGVRTDYGLGGRVAVYVLGGFDRNKFAGIKARFQEGVGLVARPITRQRDQLNVEGGIGFVQQENLSGVNTSYTALRAATSLKHSFSERAFFSQSLEYLPNLDTSTDWLLNSESALVAPLSQRVGMKFSYVVRYDNLPELNEDATARLKKSDRIFSSGIQITF